MLYYYIYIYFLLSKKKRIFTIIYIYNQTKQVFCVYIARLEDLGKNGSSNSTSIVTLILRWNLRCIVYVLYRKRIIQHDNKSNLDGLF